MDHFNTLSKENQDSIIFNMHILDISKYPFDFKELTNCFRQKIMQYHPDKYKGEDANEKSASIIEAYEKLKSFAILSPYFHNNKKEDDPNLSLFDFSEKCDHCNGRGHILREAIGRRTHGHMCYKCNDTGIYKVKCKHCNNGKFITKSGKEVSCRACKGTGLYALQCNHKENHEHELMHLMYDRFEEVTKKEICYKCKGSGKIVFEPINPVIPKGAILKC